MPIIILRDKKATKKQIEKMGYEYGSYIKVVVDIEKGVLAGGGAMHIDGERLLLEYGCKQENLWGGGVDLQTGEITYDSMINIRPKQGNAKREIESEIIRQKFDEVVKRIIL